MEEQSVKFDVLIEMVPFVLLGVGIYFLFRSTQTMDAYALSVAFEQFKGEVNARLDALEGKKPEGEASDKGGVPSGETAPATSGWKSGN